MVPIGGAHFQRNGLTRSPKPGSLSSCPGEQLAYISFPVGSTDTRTLHPQPLGKTTGLSLLVCVQQSLEGRSNADPTIAPEMVCSPAVRGSWSVGHALLDSAAWCPACVQTPSVCGWPFFEGRGLARTLAPRSFSISSPL